MLPLIKGIEAQRIILPVSHSHLNNFCNKWGTDAISGTLQLEDDNLPVVLPVVMVVQSKMCNAHQGGGPGTLLPLQHPDNWF